MFTRYLPFCQLKRLRAPAFPAQAPALFNQNLLIHATCMKNTILLGGKGFQLLGIRQFPITSSCLALPTTDRESLFSYNRAYKIAGSFTDQVFIMIDCGHMIGIIQP
jgi:hypothetical protein